MNFRKWSNLGHRKLGEVIEKVTESHGISKDQKSMNPVKIVLWSNFSTEPTCEYSRMVEFQSLHAAKIGDTQ